MTRSSAAKAWRRRRGGQRGRQRAHPRQLRGFGREAASCHPPRDLRTAPAGRPGQGARADRPGGDGADRAPVDGETLRRPRKPSCSPAASASPPSWRWPGACTRSARSSAGTSPPAAGPGSHGLADATRPSGTCRGGDRRERGCVQGGGGQVGPPHRGRGGRDDPRLPAARRVRDRDRLPERRLRKLPHPGGGRPARSPGHGVDGGREGREWAHRGVLLALTQRRADP